MPYPKTKSWIVCSITLLSLLSLGLPCLAAEYVSVNKDGVNIRSGPDTKKEILWEVFKDFPLQILKRDGKWAQTKDFEGDTGWIYSPLLSKQKKVIVKVEIANIRTGPGKNYEQVATAKYGVVFTPTETEGDWTKVSHEDGTRGWIYKKLIWPN